MLVQGQATRDVPAEEQSGPVGQWQTEHAAAAWNDIAAAAFH